MDKKKAYTIFILAAIYLVIHYMQNNNLGSELIRFYGKDLILIPLLILGISSASHLFKISVAIGLKELILTILVCIVGFEYVFPRFGMAFERDLGDILCYIGGGIFYYLLFLQKTEKHKNQLFTGTYVNNNRL